MKYIIKIFFVVNTFSVTSISWAKIKDILPTGLQIGFDVPRPLYYRWKEKTGWQYEVNGSIDFKQVLLEGDYGWGSILRKNPSGKRTSLAENIGQYFRIGLSYNFIKNSPDHNAAYLGMRYSKAYFKDYLYGKLAREKNEKGKEITPFWEDDSLADIDQQAKLQAHWFEIIGGVRVKVWGWIYAGCTARYKFAKKITIRTQNPFDIIGWGMNDEDAFGANFYIGIRIPLQAISSKQSTEEIATPSK
ncbi:MAG: hypothetical protein BGO68_04005 [Candidatus Amoebophilus sp. 36-38]|nr:MAG: hypothetical protein BGO68_04005 [Candidatus Amoebophilus sp. 36-38]